MNDEEILRMAQENPVAEAENEISRKAIIKALGIGVFFMMAMIVAELFLVKSIDLGKPALLLVISAISSILEGKNNHKKKELVIGIIEIICAFVCLLLYVGGMLR